ncbi:MAG TPA: NAD-dependent epimerase/dehydratase family protein [bacterium]|jgi:nucleoside-diphosphate-sugar epimerase|nr:NAD-dependent epimerase/dehydratase family protein [bacterium]
MKVFIIGGTGLISTAIREHLAARGDSVVLFTRGRSPLRGAPAGRRIQGDRNDEGALTEALRQEKPDAVIDMVAYEPEQAAALLRACAGNSPQVVMCSSVCVYGGPLTKLPATDEEPHRPVGDYGRRKSVIEGLVLAWEGADRHATVIRPSYTTGEGATAGGLVFDDSTVDRLRLGLPVVVMDDGRAAWAISHVSDVARAFAGALGNPRAYGQAYHVTSDEHTDWNGVFAAMAAAAGAPAPKLAHIPSGWIYRQAPRRGVSIQYILRHPSIFDNSKAARDLGFRTTVPLVETFRRQIAWMEAEGLLKPAASETVQDEMVEAYAAGRDMDPARFVDSNIWGNSTTG